ncbi:hypothetical protein T4B_9623 [Trichinella pseudospiralis]|uniref:Uncharacterized protein n=1 Tax=Trichinella pseudospiralis TaxID=6337 RepID=A0A0V1IJD9_TRIPS|nr:hypothetical protein T4B_9623 [Trichinella pseudospiralis]
MALLFENLQMANHLIKTSFDKQQRCIGKIIYQTKFESKCKGIDALAVVKHANETYRIRIPVKVTGQSRI